MTNQEEIGNSEAVKILTDLINIPSISRLENDTAGYILDLLKKKGIDANRDGNNVWARNKWFDPQKPTILLNSHHDTVAPTAAYTRDPFKAEIEDGKLHGLGSTDAGASLVCLLLAFNHFYNREDLKYNLVFVASAEEEVSGKNGIESLFSKENFQQLFHNESSFAIVGEPTQLDLAIAEKGLMVLDCEALGVAGHAARDEGVNAVYKAVEAIAWFKNYRFDKVSTLLGEVKMTVTSVETINKIHNIIPASCKFTVDVRLTERYTHEEVLEIIRKELKDIDCIPRSTRLRSSSIAEGHPVVLAGRQLGKKTYGSPTTSDQALIPLPSIKCGPGYSGQSHAADEYVHLNDIQNGLKFYIDLLNRLL